jgi:PhoH-like ATPase
MNTMKTFVVDTNVLIHRPDALLSFRNSEIVIPLWVLEELDKLKVYSDERGRNARHAVRFLDEALKRGRPNEGVRLDNGSILSIALAYARNPSIDFSADSPDNKIILTAYGLQEAGKTVFFVSKDINARVKAASLGLRAVDYEKQKVYIDKLYSGYVEAEVSGELYGAFRDAGVLAWQDELLPNQFAVLRCREGGEALLGRFSRDMGRDAGAGPGAICAAGQGVCSGQGRGLRLVCGEGIPVLGISPLNMQQRMALELLLDPAVELVSLVGKAGTGKTLLAIAAGLRMTLEEQKYSRVLVSRPVVPLGKDIGFLPGPKDEKLSHWMQPIFDNLDYILSVYKKPTLKTAEQLLASKNIELEAIAHIRGRSLPGQYIIIDEAQNLTPHEIKAIVSRAGEGTKVVLTGDPYQIDSPYLDVNSNGLSYLVDVLKGQHIFGHVTMRKSERSALAELAAELL